MWTTEKRDDIVTGMDTTIGGFNLDDVRSKGMTIRIGGKVVTLAITEETTLPEEEIREEYRKLVNERLGVIKGALNEKVSELSYMVEQAKQDFEEKERALQQRLSEANLMPDITHEHARQGLSVVKGSARHRGEGDVLTWLYQGVYWPKFYDGRPIDPKYSKRLVTPVTLEVVTRGDTVVSLILKKTIGLEKFQHYHGFEDSHADCWGDYHAPSNWTSPSDIIAMGRNAMAVLENINPMSPAQREPAGLPRLSTIQNHTLERGASADHRAGRADERTGVAVADRGEGDDIWNTG